MMIVNQQEKFNHSVEYREQLCKFDAALLVEQKLSFKPDFNQQPKHGSAATVHRSTSWAIENLRSTLLPL